MIGFRVGLAWLAGYGVSDPELNGEFAFMHEIEPLGGRYPRQLFDVGSNKGDFAERLRETFPKTTIHLFEPVSHLFEELDARFADDPNAVVSQRAVGPRPGSVVVHESCDGSGMHSIYRRAEFQYGRSETVEMTSLDEYARTAAVSFIDYCKVDVEGSEAAIVDGAKCLIEERRIGMVQFEYGETYRSAGTTLLAVHALFRLHGYTVGRVTPFGLIRVDLFSPRKENYRHSNWVAIHPGAKLRRFHPWSLRQVREVLRRALAR